MSKSGVQNHFDFNRLDRLEGEGDPPPLGGSPALVGCLGSAKLPAAGF